MKHTLGDILRMLADLGVALVLLLLISSVIAGLARYIP